MRLLKSLALILSLIMVSSVLAACSKAPTKTTASSKNNRASKEGLAHDLYEYTISLEDQVYTLPVPFSEFAKNGWEGTNLDSKKLNPNYLIDETLSKGDITITVIFANFSTDILPYSECHVAGVTIDSNQQNNKAKLLLSNRITFGSSYSDVKKAYGEAVEENKNEDYISMYYGTGKYSYYKLSFNKKKLSGIEVRNAVAPKNFSKGKNDANTEMPDLVKKYEAPTSLGKDLSSYEFKLDGDLYKLPVPLVELEKNGWKLDIDTNEILSATHIVSGVTLKKGSNAITVDIRNYGTTGAPLKHCFITSVEYSKDSCQLPIELPGGISEKSTAEEVIAAYGEPEGNNNISGKTNILYGSYTSNALFVFEENKLLELTLNHKLATIDKN